MQRCQLCKQQLALLDLQLISEGGGLARTHVCGQQLQLICNSSLRMLDQRLQALIQGNQAVGHVSQISGDATKHRCTSTR